MPEASILIRYHQGNATPEEQEVVRQWLEASKAHQQEFNEVIAIWEHAENAGVYASIDAAADWEKVRKKIGEETKIRPLNSRSLWQRYRWVAAAVVVLLATIGLRYWYSQQVPSLTQIAQTEPKDSPMSLTLADGSKVWLNADSRLEYPVGFDGKERLVRLEGEAYFEVEHRAEQPFVVVAGRSRTKVLGTRFNINAYEEIGEILVAVEEGKVAFSSEINPKEKVVVTKGQQGKMDPGGQVELIASVDAGTFSWKSGKLSFQDRPLKEVLLQLIAHHKKAYSFKSEKGMDCLLTNSWNDESLEEALEELKDLLGLRYSFNEQSGILEIEGADCE